MVKFLTIACVTTGVVAASSNGSSITPILDCGQICQRPPVKSLEYLTAVHSIQHLLARYPVAIDGKDWSQLGSIFAADATASFPPPLGDLVGSDGITSAISQGLGIFASTHHSYGTQLIEVCLEDTAVALTYLTATHFMVETTNLSETVGLDKVLYSYGQYLDKVERGVDGKWKIAQRTLAMMVSLDSDKYGKPSLKQLLIGSQHLRDIYPIAKMKLEKNDGQTAPLIRPGFGKEFWEMPDDDAAFPSTIAILWFVEKITNKPDWYVKVFDEQIVAKWKQEVMAVDWKAVGLNYAYFDDDLFTFVSDWLQIRRILAGSARRASREGQVFQCYWSDPIFDAASTIIKSDSAITPEVKEAHKQGVAALEDIPENEKDGHPRSDGKVLNLVHPSLWPLVFEKSRIVADKRILLKDTLAASGRRGVIPVPKKRYPNHQSSDDLWSVKYQWLPCDIDIEEDHELH
ncbi:hypothetical protein GCG54_00015172 [Colletotrichum gloeosporioides]|uniref:SnoaL-like domain-containing protein n=1 Tax=Colletotrichum gloeosporioides TaxID=474922 RepID=A0A8H4FI88_COLGL|nr:uncharacterized protein GCG54_00015172 [Colletotrichum gloeosporioides]KAF3801949.1 hypothetical protein GCG54_00015172 [Colletotrichum gloeosporioides]